MRRFVVRPTAWALGHYLAFTAVLMPTLAIRRVLGLGEPGELRNMVLPILLLLMVLAFGPSKVVKPRAWLQFLFACAFLQALLMGLLSGRHEEDTRSFLSHLFQLGSAYLMVGIGWLSADRFSREFWRNWTALSLVAIFISTALTIGALDRGEVGRLYTPAYGLILVVAYAAAFSRGGVIAAFLLALVSNKRAVVLGLVVQAVYQWSRNAIMTRGSRYVAWVATRSVIFAFTIIVVGWAIVGWAEGQYEGGVARAINITMNRLQPLLAVFSDQVNVTSLSAGRDIEVISALEQSRWWYWIVGGGAGWSVDIGDRYVHNIHTSPLSIALVFGLPFALLLYGSLVWMLVRSFRKGLRSNDATSLIAPVYLSGALIHSLFAYSLFVDLLVFFFAGVAARNLSAAGSRNSTTAQ